MDRMKLVSFADDKMYTSQQCLQKSFYNNAPGFILKDLSVSPLWFAMEEPDFMMFNEKIFRKKRGVGYWIWKPFIIYKAFSGLTDGEYILYCDAGIEIIRSIKPLVDMNEDILLFDNVWQHSQWCKRDVVNAMLPGWFVHDYTQVQASVILIRKSEKTVDFVKEWLAWCQVPGFIDDSPSTAPNIPAFREHRHDQAILTNLAIKYNIKKHWWPVDYNLGEKSKFPGDNYDIIFDHHRRRNAGIVENCSNNKPQPTW